MKDQSLESLIKNLSPRLNDGEFVFCLDIHGVVASEACLGSFLENEGKTVVVSKDEAKRLGLEFEAVMRWITLDVHSSLEAVGLTARVATSLATAGIACNVIAGYHHDHLFVPTQDAERAVALLHAI